MGAILPTCCRFRSSEEGEKSWHFSSGCRRMLYVQLRFMCLSFRLHSAGWSSEWYYKVHQSLDSAMGACCWSQIGENIYMEWQCYWLDTFNSVSNAKNVSSSLRPWSQIAKRHAFCSLAFPKCGTPPSGNRRAWLWEGSYQIRNCFKNLNV